MRLIGLPACTQGSTQLLYEDYSFVLSVEIANRAQLGKPLLEEEMWYILYSLMRAGSLYEKTDKKIGDVQPANIVINEEGNIKVVSVDAWPSRLDNYDSVCTNRSKLVFLGTPGPMQPPRSASSSSSGAATTRPSSISTWPRSSASA